jgi:hypothetical protein
MPSCFPSRVQFGKFQRYDTAFAVTNEKLKMKREKCKRRRR